MDEPVAIFKKRSNKSAIRKRPATPPPVDSNSSQYSSSDDENGKRIKRRRKNVGYVSSINVTGSKTSTEVLEGPKYAADRSAVIESSNDATKQSNWYDESKTNSLDSKSLLGTTRARPTAPVPEGANGTYKGTAAYQSFITKNSDAPSKTIGPVKAPTNIRTITVTDFAPDVCKDYKQTGFCGFGDSCKFLHAREDYKQGWELDRDWEVGTKGKKLRGTTVASAANREKDDEEEDDDALLENIPFACIICKRPYTNPVITKCGHYFCESCALGRYRKNPSCAACGAGTGGVFNGAKGLKKLLERKRERAQKRREKAREAGEEISSEDDVEDNEE